MKEIDISDINKEFTNKIRLGIMSALMVNKWLSFNDLKQMLEVTDGNLNSHTSVLENNKYILIKKAFVGKKPETSYKMTNLGRMEFEKHIEALNSLINKK